MGHLSLWGEVSLKTRCLLYLMLEIVRPIGSRSIGRSWTIDPAKEMTIRQTRTGKSLLSRPRSRASKKLFLLKSSTLQLFLRMPLSKASLLFSTATWTKLGLV